MTSLHSRVQGEAHLTQHSAERLEPPKNASSSTLDEGVSTQGSAEKWGNEMGEKQPTTLQVVFQNVGGFVTDEDMEVKLEVL